VDYLGRPCRDLVSKKAAAAERERWVRRLPEALAEVRDGWVAVRSEADMGSWVGDAINLVAAEAPPPERGRPLIDVLFPDDEATR